MQVILVHGTNGDYRSFAPQMEPHDARYACATTTRCRGTARASSPRAKGKKNLTLLQRSVTCYALAS